MTQIARSRLFRDRHGLTARGGRRSAVQRNCGEEALVVDAAVFFMLGKQRFVNKRARGLVCSLVSWSCLFSPVVC